MDLITIDTIKKEYPNIKVEALNNGTGCNVYLPGKLVLTVWFKKGKFYSNQLKVWRRFSNQKDLLTIIGILGNLQLKQTVSVEKPEDNVVQKIIDLIERKYQLFTKLNPHDHQTATMLKTIKSELHQFL